MGTQSSTVSRQTEATLADAAKPPAGRTMVRAAPGMYRRAWRRFRRDHVAIASLVVILCIIAFALAAPLVSNLTGFSYSENHLSEKLSNPGENGYILGSDGNGRDILTRLAYGGRVTLLVATFATLAELSLGLGFGLISGYYGRWIDTVIMRAVDVLLSIPSLPLLILVATLYSPGVILFAVIIGAIYWPADARLLRGEVLSLRGREYIEAARVVGVPSRSIILRHLLPNVTPILLVQASLTVPSVILTEAALSFLGLGVQVPTPSWGNMLQEAQRFYRQQWENVFIPGLMIYISALCLYLVGIGLRDALDPRLGD
ncbi:MAG: peptide/nickel transport system permease protein [Thermomicrobiales bacterium]|jgi:peptide/nickel transport system permease protein|nr:peptide/nickel transport system permease protein [Thermomicrobiales bacterium]MEA2583527.1 peptide/nickel transport system permease protein [Thermomicrobiales bacterium]MEA2594046.1 peptide/nickel transport system permease protein [Thermomicrobiales bacterium]